MLKFSPDQFPTSYYFFSRILDKSDYLYLISRFLVIFNYLQTFMLSFIPFILLKDGKLVLIDRIFHFFVSFNLKRPDQVITNYSLFITSFISVLFGIIFGYMFYSYTKRVHVKPVLGSLLEIRTIFFPTIALCPFLSCIAFNVSSVSSNSYSIVKLIATCIFCFGNYFYMYLFIKWAEPLLSHHPLFSNSHMPSRIVPDSFYINSITIDIIIAMIPILMPNISSIALFIISYMFKSYIMIKSLWKKPYINTFETAFSISIYICHIIMPVVSVVFLIFVKVSSSLLLASGIIVLIVSFLILNKVLSKRVEGIVELCKQDELQMPNNEDELLIIIQSLIVSDHYSEAISNMCQSDTVLSSPSALIVKLYYLILKCNNISSERLTSFFITLSRLNSLTWTTNYMFFELLKNYVSYYMFDNVFASPFKMIEIQSNIQIKANKFKSLISQKSLNSSLDILESMKNDSIQFIMEADRQFSFLSPFFDETDNQENEEYYSQYLMKWKSINEFYKYNITDINDRLESLYSQKSSIFQRFSRFINLPEWIYISEKNNVKNSFSSNILFPKTIEIERKDIAASISHYFDIEFFWYNWGLIPIFVIFCLIGFAFGTISSFRVLLPVFDFISVSNYANTTKQIFGGWSNISMTLMHIINSSSLSNRECNQVYGFLYNYSNYSISCIYALFLDANKTSLLIQEEMKNFTNYFNIFRSNSLLSLIENFWINSSMNLFYKSTKLPVIIEADLFSSLIFYTSQIMKEYELETPNNINITKMANYFRNMSFHFSQVSNRMLTLIMSSIDLFKESLNTDLLYYYPSWNSKPFKYFLGIIVFSYIVYICFQIIISNKLRNIMYSTFSYSLSQVQKNESTKDDIKNNNIEKENSSKHKRLKFQLTGYNTPFLYFFLVILQNVIISYLIYVEYNYAINTTNAIISIDETLMKSYLPILDSIRFWQYPNESNIQEDILRNSKNMFLSQWSLLSSLEKHLIPAISIQSLYNLLDYKCSNFNVSDIHELYECWPVTHQINTVSMYLKQRMNQNISFIDDELFQHVEHMFLSHIHPQLYSLNQGVSSLLYNIVDRLEFWSLLEIYLTAVFIVIGLFLISLYFDNFKDYFYQFLNAQSIYSDQDSMKLLYSPFIPVDSSSVFAQIQGSFVFDILNTIHIPIIIINEKKIIITATSAITKYIVYGLDQLFGQSLNVVIKEDIRFDSHLEYLLKKGNESKFAQLLQVVDQSGPISVTISHIVFNKQNYFVLEFPLEPPNVQISNQIDSCNDLIDEFKNESFPYSLISDSDKHNNFQSKKFASGIYIHLIMTNNDINNFSDNLEAITKMVQLSMNYYGGYTKIAILHSTPNFVSAFIPNNGVCFDNDNCPSDFILIALMFIKSYLNEDFQISGVSMMLNNAEMLIFDPPSVIGKHSLDNEIPFEELETLKPCFSIELISDQLDIIPSMMPFLVPDTILFEDFPSSLCQEFCTCQTIYWKNFAMLDKNTIDRVFLKYQSIFNEKLRTENKKMEVNDE